MTAGRIVIGMSGGLDSSVAALKLKQDGYDVLGLTLLLYPEASRCCNIQDVEDARRIADYLGIPHKIQDCTEAFISQIVTYFSESYISGLTPNPCFYCNPLIKFRYLEEYADQVNADYLATGHYASLIPGQDYPFLTPAKDRDKSQEYFLAMLGPPILKRILFPLESLYKSDVIQWARDSHLPLKEKKESQDICFVSDGNYVSFLKRTFDVPDRPGTIVDTTGHKRGEHSGYFYYTVGQRQGLGISARYPLYVVDVEPEQNLIIVGEKKDASRDRIRVTLVTWRLETDCLSCFVRIRYRHSPASAKVIIGDKFADILFDEPQFAPAPGQAAVFYDVHDRVIGAGIIQRTGAGD